MAKRLTVSEVDDNDDDDDSVQLQKPTAAPRTNILDILAKIADSEGGQKKSGLSEFELLKLKMEEDRAEREERRSREFRQMVIGLATALGPAVLSLFNRGPDPIMMKLLESTMAGHNNKEHFSALMELTTKANAQQLQQAIAGMAQINEAKDEAWKTILERTREEGGGGGGFNLADLLRAAKPILDSQKNNPQPSPHEVATLEEGRKEEVKTVSHNPKPLPPAVVVMKTLMQIHQDTGLTAKERVILKSGIVATIVQDEELADLFVDGDQEKIIEAFKPVVMNDSKILSWIAGEGVGFWLHKYVEKQITPMVQEAVFGEQEENEEEENDNERNEKENTEGKGADPTAPASQG